MPKEHLSGEPDFSHFDLRTPPDEVFGYIDAGVSCHILVNILDRFSGEWFVVPCDEQCAHEPVRLERDEAGGFTATTGDLVLGASRSGL